MNPPKHTSTASHSLTCWSPWGPSSASDERQLCRLPSHHLVPVQPCDLPLLASQVIAVQNCLGSPLSPAHLLRLFSLLAALPYLELGFRPRAGAISLGKHLLWAHLPLTDKPPVSLSVLLNQMP